MKEEIKSGEAEMKSTVTAIEEKMEAAIDRSKFFMVYAVEMALWDMIYVPSTMKIGTDFQAILRFSLSNLNGCNVGITDEN
jgi:hypothetical protein